MDSDAPDPPVPRAGRTVRDRVAAVVAEALDVPLSDIHEHSSLADDLGAESIDFLDIVFRLESEFGLKIPERDLWGGAVDVTDREALDAHLATLKQRLPAFRWDRLPPQLAKHDLPRLITVRTILDYLERRGLTEDDAR